jgi:hypothetical protein
MKSQGQTLSVKILTNTLIKYNIKQKPENPNIEYVIPKLHP